MRYILYARKSTEDKGRQILSLESQTTEMQHLADTLGLNIVKTFTESKSAKKPDNRPLFAQMLKTFERGEADGIICWKLDRLSRNPIDSGQIQWLLQQGKIKAIQTMEKQYLPSDNVILFSVETGMANQYILDLSKNVKRGIKTKIEKGDFPNRAPIGYGNDPITRKITLDKERAIFIKRAFTLYATGSYGLKELASKLYAEGFRSRSNIKYHKSKLHKILRNTFYYGVIKFDDKFYQGNQEPIISKQLFDSVQEVLEGKNRSRRKSRFLALRGKMICEKCGCLLTGAVKKEKFVYYYCTNGKGGCDEHKKYMPEEKAFELIAGLFDKIQFDEEFIDMCYQADLEKSKLNSGYTETIKEKLDNRLKTVDEERLKLLDIQITGKYPESVIAVKLEGLNKEEIDIKQELKQLLAKKGIKDKNTLELTKKVFLEANLAKKDFLGGDNLKRVKILEKLLWNASVENFKIANFTFKMPYQVLANAPDKHDFESMRRVRDLNPRRF